MRGASGSRRVPFRGALEVEPSDILVVLVDGANKLCIEDATMKDCRLYDCAEVFYEEIVVRRNVATLRFGW